MYCVACVPAVIVTGIVRGSPGAAQLHDVLAGRQRQRQRRHALRLAVDERGDAVRIARHDQRAGRRSSRLWGRRGEASERQITAAEHGDGPRPRA